jgi:hypothetical protein
VQNNAHRKCDMMAALNKYRDWIQLVLLIGGMILIYGQQVQTVKDVERRTTQCEVDIKQQNISSSELIKAIYELRGEIKSLKTEIRYLSKSQGQVQ